MRDQHINVSFSEENGGYIADIPGLDACSAFGRTPQEPVVQARDAWLATAEEQGRPNPEARYQPAAANP